MATFHQEHTKFLALAAEQLGGEAQAFDLDFSLAQIIRTRGVREGYGPAGDLPPFLLLTSHQPGHNLEYGMTRYRMELPSGPIRVLHLLAPRKNGEPYDLFDCWFVKKQDLVPLYRWLRRANRPGEAVQPPVLPDPLRQKLWDNTVGFLRGQTPLFERYGVAAKRGVLLLGEPGNGKTLSCRWLRYECARRGLAWRTVTMEQLDEARSSGDANSYFEMSEPGMVLFDDVDSVIRDRRAFGETPLHHVLLAGLDGISAVRGVVYIFTSNVVLSQIDAAFRRPGRIDVVLHFDRPDATLRRRLIQERWHADMQAALDLPAIVRQTDGVSFADLEELKKLLVLEFIESRRWNWSAAWSQFRQGRGPTASAPIGFGAAFSSLTATPLGAEARLAGEAGDLS